MMTMKFKSRRKRLIDDFDLPWSFLRAIGSRSVAQSRFIRWQLSDWLHMRWITFVGWVNTK